MSATVKVLTIHVKNVRLTPELAQLILSVSEALRSPRMHTTQEGLVISVDSYDRLVSR